jgi:hypothetical protein
VDLTNQQGRQSIGSVTWRTELVKATGKSDALTAHADVDIPSRGLRMTMSFKPNLDPTSPASHEIEMTFQVSTDRSGGRLTNVPGVLMKFNQQARGMPLAGLSVKVTGGVFLVGLSNTAADRWLQIGDKPRQGNVRVRLRGGLNWHRTIRPWASVDQSGTDDPDAGRRLCAFTGSWTEFEGDRGPEPKPVPGPHLVYGFRRDSLRAKPTRKVGLRRERERA